MSFRFCERTVTLGAKKNLEEIDTAVNTQHWVCVSQKKKNQEDGRY